ncbi:hypothetical protein GCM10008955_30540 [Deinococcus malanensis]|uniref:Tetratricopeptide repeat protein n=1 Tax=Deinococcus malanensis TaxID=1706855 RepID=A0ABQ2F289_9DEIO|nr:hypothetical protein [Deinococcus malanensis]GGK34420.1 hypothetical protein GCM10008955_30540 [Deinococcus malanensis]
MPALAPQLLLDLVTRRLAAGRKAPATLWARTAVHAAPASAHSWAALGAAHMQQQRWHPAQLACRQAVHLDPTHREAWTNFGQAASARWDAETASHAWAALGIAILSDEGQERMQVRFQTECGSELVNAERLNPAMALLVGIPTPATGHRCGDVVLLNDLDGHPYTQLGQVYRVFQAQAVVQPSRRSTWHAVLHVPWTDHLPDLYGHTSWFLAVAHTWPSGSLRDLKDYALVHGDALREVGHPDPEGGAVTGRCTPKTGWLHLE